MSSLFTPYKLGPVTLRNRTVRSAAFESMGRHFGPTEQLKEYHVSVARGGVGMTTLAYAAVCRSGLSFDKQLWLRPEIVPGLRGITDAVHREGAAAGIQIGHCGNMTHLTTAGQIPIGASTGFNLYAYTPVRGMRKDEIAQVARDFGKAVHTAHDAGFDSVEVHAGHGYLISQFLSPYTNHRKDEYGGTLENRMRFMRMCLTEVMEAAEGSEVAKKSKVAEGLGVAASADGSGAPGREPAAAIAEATGEPGAETDGNGALAAGSAQQGVGSGKECGNRATAAVTPDVRVIAIDLARVGAAQELYDRMTAEGIVVDVVINNAGIFSFCDILATPAERIERIILLHDLTVTQLCRLFAADMVRRGVRGHILNMSSYSLWMPFPGLALYSASKAYMRSFSVAFAKEVRERGIRVTALCPAGVATDLYGLTPYWQRIGCKLGVLITPDSCARRGLKALWRGRRCIVPDWWNRAWIPFCKVLPMWVLRPVRRFTMKFQK